MEARVYLTKAENSLKAAELCFENGLYDDAANRAYFSVLQMALALLVTHNVFPVSKRLHAWVQGNFSKELVRKRKVYPKRMARYLSDLRNEREASDYKLQFISKKSAKVVLKKSKEFYEIGNKELKKIAK